MWPKIEHWLKLDQNPNEEQRRMRMILYWIGSLMIVLTLTFWIITLAVDYQTASITTAIGVVFSVALMALNWLGHLKWVKLLYPGLSLVFVIVAIRNGDGLYDEVLIALPALIAMAGLLMGRRGAVLFTILGILTIIGFGYIHMQHGFVKFDREFILPRMVILIFMIAFSGVLIYLAIDNLAAGIARLRQNEQILSAKNQELEDIRISLEDQVLERTRRAETARHETEKAHADLQLQMWQIAGQEQLSAILRSEQDLTRLGDRVLSLICRYLDLPFGALFTRSDPACAGGWNFSGGYACRPGDQTPAYFRVGEGLVGQAAKEKRTITVESISPSQIQICSGLGATLPRYLLLLPLLHGEQAIGVIELAGMTAFTAEQIKFLNHSAESIAITLHTASKLQGTS